MQTPDPTPASDAEALCLACGLCCDGSLFAWAKLRPGEMEPARAAGLPVFMDAPPQRGFTQPCPMLGAGCSIYTSTAYPHACRAYRCLLLKRLQNNDLSLQQALQSVAATRAAFAAFAQKLDAAGRQAGPAVPMRTRLVQVLEDRPAPRALLPAARRLLAEIEQVYGVMDLLDG